MEKKSGSSGKEEKKKKKKGMEVEHDAVSPFKTVTTHVICGLGLASAIYGGAHRVYSVDLTSDPSLTLLITWGTMAPIVMLTYSMFRKDPNQCSYWRAVGRGLLGLLPGAVLNALGAIALGAPVGSKYFQRTLNWSLLMSSLTVVPAASVFGSSWSDWQRIFSHTKPTGTVDYMICLPAHGAIIGAWFGAWPMPLDWERPWQEWPISVTYGTLVGYVVAVFTSFICTLLRGENRHIKSE